MRKRKETRYIVVHCSATRPGSDIGYDEIDDMHRRRVPPFDKIGYHAVIRRSGKIEFGRHFDAVGAHVKGYNYQSIGICLVGGIDDDGNAADNFEPIQKIALRHLLAVLSRAYIDAEILGHRDLSPDIDGDGVVERDEWLKECPCFDVQKWLVRND